MFSAETSVCGVDELARKEGLGEAPIVFPVVHLDPFPFYVKFTPSRYNFSRFLVGHNSWKNLQEEG